jgi:Tol biopolymer transport system component
MPRCVAEFLFVLLVAVTGACGGADETPADDGLIAFTINRSGDQTVAIIRPDGSGRRELGAGSMPKWSPDGRLLAFASRRDFDARGDADPGDEAVDVYVMRPDGQGVRRLTWNRTPDYPAFWTRAGDVAVISCPTSVLHCDLVAVSPGGKPKGRLRSGALFDVAGIPSPDGRHLAFAKWSGPSERAFVTREVDVVVANPDGSNEDRLTETFGIDVPGGWSVDGKIVFVSDRDRNGRCLFHDCVGYATEIYVMDDDGSDERRLTTFAGPDGDPTWSPGGKRIAYARIRRENADHDLWLMNADGTCARALTTGGAWEYQPSWKGPADGDGPLEC